MFNNNLFNTKPKKLSDIVIVSDMFSEDYGGGAELTTDSLLTYCDKEFSRVRSKELNEDDILNNKDSIWIFTNFSQINFKLIPVIANNINSYHIIEYDYKFCMLRLPQHPYHGKECDCHNSAHGLIISEFYSFAKTLNWMSKAQMDFYLDKFPRLKKNNNFVLSSIFSQRDLQTIKELSKSRQTQNLNSEMLILGSKSWVKGFDRARDYCEEHNLDSKVIWDVPYEECLKLMASHRGIVYMPNGFDTCPRWVIEAKLLGCSLIYNEYVQNREEEWFQQSQNKIIKYLSDQPLLFWKRILNNE